MTSLASRRRRRSLGVPRHISIESMDRESLICEAILLDESIERALSIYWEPDDETCRRVGWHLVSNTGTRFHIGRRLLELSSGGALLPPPEFRMCLQTEPTEEEMFAAPMLQPWSLILFQSGLQPAYWRLGGTVHHRDYDCTWIWTRLRYLHREKVMAMTDDGWLRLGKRMSA